MKLFDSLNFAPLDEVWSPRANIAPTIENPYASEPEVVNRATSPVIENRCQQYLEDVYESQGVRGLLTILDPHMVRDIQSLAVRKHRPQHRDPFTISFDELILVAFGIFALVLAIES
jgi:hypothetical protein